MERYRILGKVGEGGSGVVYRVLDRAVDRVRAMKVMPRRADRATMRDEFIALARLRHENIVRVYDYGLTPAGDDFYTMDFVDGPALLAWARSATVRDVLLVFGGVLRALSVLHARRVVHADVKPSNILLELGALQRAPQDAPKLVDFGLAGADGDSATGGRGTFPYVAPEVYAGKVDARSDLYALGVVMYEALTGGLPYETEDVPATLLAQRRGPPSPEPMRPMPARAAALLRALLDPCAGARPQTAEEVLAELAAITGASLTGVKGLPLIDFGSGLVGRERVLAELGCCSQQARCGAGAALIVEGEAGMGKSRMLAEFALLAQTDGAHVFRTTMRPNPGSDDSGISRLARALLAHVGEDVAHPRFEVLTRLVGGRADGGAVRTSHVAIAEALVEVVSWAAGRSPIAIAVDDLELADAGERELLLHLARGVRHLAVVLLYAARGPSDGFVDAIAALPHGTRIPLEPLAAPAVLRLIEHTLSAEIARDAGDELARVSGGVPGALAASLDDLVARGVVGRRGGRWVMLRPVGTLAPPPDLVGAALASVARLDGVAQDVLRAASVLGEQFYRCDLEELVAFDGVTLAQVTDALTAGASLRILRADPASGRGSFVHRDVAERLYAQLAAERRIALHTRALAVTEGRAPPAALWAHYVALGRMADAARSAELAAERCTGVHGASGVRVWLRRAREALPLGSDDRLRVEERLAAAAAQAGDTDEAIAGYQRVFERGRDPEQRARAACQLGELLGRRGDSDAACDVLMRAVALAREHGLMALEAQCHLGLGVLFMYQADYERARAHALSGRLLASSAGEGAIAARLGRLIGNLHIYEGDPGGATACLQEALAAARDAGAEVAAADVLVAMGRAALHLNQYERATRAFEEALATYEHHGRVADVARVLNNLGAAQFFTGKWRETRRTWERFRDLCERLDDRAELVNALNNLGLLYGNTGELDAAAAAFDEAAAVAAAVGHAHMAAMAHGNRGDLHAVAGEHDHARRCYTAALEAFEAIGAREGVLESKRRLVESDIALGRPQVALDEAIHLFSEVERSGSKMELAMLGRAAARAARLLGDLESAAWLCGRSEQTLRAIGVPFERAQTSLEAAEIAAARGNMREADRALLAAIDAFADLGARGWLQRARARRDELAAQLRARGGGAAETGAEVVGSRGSEGADHLLGTILDTIMEAGDFDRGAILLGDGAGHCIQRVWRRRGPVTGDNEPLAITQSIVRQVMETRDPVHVADANVDPRLDDRASVAQLGLRRVVAFPIRLDSALLGVLYLDSERAETTPVVDDDQLRALAVLAGMAIGSGQSAELERRRAEVLGMVAHELRAPLCGMLALADPAELDAIDDVDALKRRLAQMHADARRLNRLIDNTLEFARAETSAAREWSMAEQNVRRLLEEVASSIRAEARTRGVEIELEVDGDVGNVVVNGDRMAQVVRNLLANAVKFTRQGSRVTVRAARELVADETSGADHMPFVRVDVTDGGHGIPADECEVAFEKFAQGTRSGSRGLGLGLYISKRIVERHRGSIWIASTSDRGTTVSFRVPAVA